MASPGGNIHAIPLPDVIEGVEFREGISGTFKPPLDRPVTNFLV